jgi:DNA helicase IV
MVDEATDFSPIQLACMAALSHPRINSFFACGDFNQRLTVWGSRSINQLKETIHIEERTVAIAYRQTRQLSEFGRLIIESSSGDTCLHQHG